MLWEYGDRRLPLQLVVGPHRSLHTHRRHHLHLQSDPPVPRNCGLEIPRPELRGPRTAASEEVLGLAVRAGQHGRG